MIAKTEGRRGWGSIFQSSSNQEQEYSLMLPKDLLTRNSTSIWKWCTKNQNQSLKTAITSTRFKEHSIQSCLTEEQLTKQPKPRTRIVQLPNIILASRRILSHKTNLPGFCSNSLWLATHMTLRLLRKWWKFDFQYALSHNIATASLTPKWSKQGC